MLAILLMALLASAVALSFSRPLQSARAREAISQVHFADAQARQAARQFSAPVKLVLDPSENSITRYEGEHLRASITLPSAIRMQEVIVGRHATWEDRAEVWFSSSGLSRSYAIHLAGPAFNQWVLFAGFSGQMTWVSDEKTLQSMLDITAPTGRDAD
jgi:type II secretory pathway pseudopilin PulG